MKVKRILFFGFDLLLLPLVFAIFFSVAYVFGKELVSTNLDFYQIGNDSPFALSLIDWYNRWFPNIPLWFPGQGSGVSITQAYPLLPTFVVIAVHRIFNLSLVAAYRVVIFAVFPLTSLGIYFFAKTRLKSRTIGFIAGIFFLLSQASWVFQRIHGTFAQSFSFIFMAPTLLFFDWYLDKSRTERGGFKKRLAFFLTVVFLGLSFMAHPITGSVMIMAIFLYSFIFAFLHKDISEIKRSFTGLILQKIKPIPKYLTRSIIVVFTFIFLFSFFLIPYNSYVSFANREGLLTYSLEMLREVSLLPSTLIGFNNFGTDIYRHDFFFFAYPVVLLSLIGLIFSLLRSKKVLLLSVLVAFFSFFSMAAVYLGIIVNKFLFLFSAVNYRSIIFTIIFLPIVAAYGAWAPFNTLIIYLPKKVFRIFSKKEGKYIRVILGFVRMVADISVSILALSLFFIFINKFDHKPLSDTMKLQQPWGIESFDAYGPTLNDDWQTVLVNPQKIIDSIKGFRIEGGEILEPDNGAFLEFLDSEKPNYKTRMDASPFGIGESLMKTSFHFTDASFANLYNQQSSIIHSMWGYQAGVFYGNAGIYDNPTLLSELQKWYAFDYVFIKPNWDRDQNYRKVGFELFKDYPNLGYQIYKYPNTGGNLYLSDKPAILVIGDASKGAYEQVFRIANTGALSFDKTLLIQGEKSVESYSLEDLKAFDGLILHGYSYKSKSQVWKLLNSYLEAGGRVFINTGWQYVNNDWGKDNGKAVFPETNPVTLTQWGALNTDWDNASVDASLGNSFNLNNFSPLSWRGESWNMAYADVKSLSKGSEPLLRIGDNVLMARKKIGKGQIVWTGFNIFSHIAEYRNQDEIDFLTFLLDSLFEYKKGSVYENTDYARSFPDKVEISINQDIKSPAWLLWRESYSPNWKLTVNKGKKLELLSAGPGFIISRIPASDKGDILKLEYKLNVFEGIVARTISLTTFVFLIFYLIKGEYVEKNILGKILKPLRRKSVNLKESFGTSEDEDY